MRIKRNQLSIVVDQPRWFAGRRLASLRVAIDVPETEEGGPRSLDLTLDVDAGLDSLTLRQLQLFCGGVDWPRLVNKALLDAALTFPERIPVTNTEELEVVFSASLERPHLGLAPPVRIGSRC
jgi:hypothetical protein